MIRLVSFYSVPYPTKHRYLHLEAILLEDGLASTAPNIRMIEHYKLRYILGAKPGDHQFLFDQLENEHVYHEITDMEGEHQFRFLNQASLNESNQEVRVNVLEYRHTDPKEKEVNFSKCTSLG